MSTVMQQVLDRLDALLLARVPAGCKVFRDRADAESRAEAPAVNVLAEEGAVEAMGEMDRHELMVELRISVRTEPGAMACDDVHAPIHGPLVTDSALAALCESRRLVEYAFDRAEADGTATTKTARYRFIYLIPSNTL